MPRAAHLPSLKNSTFKKLISGRKHEEIWHLLLDVVLPFDLIKHHQHQHGSSTHHRLWKQWTLPHWILLQLLHYSSWSPGPWFPNEMQNLKRGVLVHSTVAHPCLLSDQVKHLWHWHQDYNSCRSGPGSWISFTVPSNLAVLFVCEFLCLDTAEEGSLSSSFCAGDDLLIHCIFGPHEL